MLLQDSQGRSPKFSQNRCPNCCVGIQKGHPIVMLREKHHYLTYLMSKKININTLFLAIVGTHVSCFLRIYLIMYKIIQVSSRYN